MKNVAFLTLTLLFSSLYTLHAQDTAIVCPSQEVIDENTLLNVFPNPSNGTFQIVYASTTSCPPPGWGGVLMINVINSNGKIVYTESVNDFEGVYNQTIDLSTHPKGTYIIEVVSGKQKRVKRETLN